MPLADGKEKGGEISARKGGFMKSLEKATADFEKAKERMEASKARYEADLKRFKKAESDKIEAENMEIVRIFREMNMSIPELEKFRATNKAELPGAAVLMKEETTHNDEFIKKEREEFGSEAGRHS